MKVEVHRVGGGKLANYGVYCQAQALVWPGMGAQFRSMHYIRLSPGQASRPLQHESEAVYFFAQGDGVVEDLDTGQRTPVGPGHMILCDPGTRYRFVDRGSGLTVLGGPCPPDPVLYAGLP